MGRVSSALEWRCNKENDGNNRNDGAFRKEKKMGMAIYACSKVDYIGSYDEELDEDKIYADGSTRYLCSHFQL